MRRLLALALVLMVGAGLLIQKTQVPAVPVLIAGSYEEWPPGRSLPRIHPIHLTFGQPLSLADSEPDGEADGAARIADRLREAVVALDGRGSDDAPARTAGCPAACPQD